MAQIATTKAGRAPLTREAVIHAAVRLVDQDGPEALSMRRLAADLGIEAMSLYYHVPNKAALIDGVAETVLAEMDISRAARGTWEERVRGLARAFREVALAHPRSFPLVLTRQLGSAVALRPIEAALSVLRDAGFDRATAVHALRSFVAFQTGSLMREFGASPALSGLSPSGVAARKDELERSQFPMVVEAAPLLAVCHHEREYEFGVELLIVALQQLRGRKKRPLKR
jgi:AcrR family transcriptional regulator